MGTNHNPHVHLLVTTRKIEADSFGSKLTALNQKQFILNVRKRYEALANTALQKVGSLERIDHRSYAARGIDKAPTRHRGPDKQERQHRRAARRVEMPIHNTRLPIQEIEKRQYYRDDTSETFIGVEDPRERISFADPRVRDFILERTNDVLAATRDPLKRERAELSNKDSREDTQPSSQDDRAASALTEGQRDDGPDLEKPQRTALQSIKRAGEIARDTIFTDRALERDYQQSLIDMRARETSAEWDAYDPARTNPEDFPDERMEHNEVHEYNTYLDARMKRDAERYPEAGPEGRPIARSDLDKAQDRMIEDLERQADRQPQERLIHRESFDAARLRAQLEAERAENLSDERQRKAREREEARNQQQRKQRDEERG